MAALVALLAWPTVARKADGAPPTPPEALPPVVVTASPLPLPADRAPASVTIVPAEWIQQFRIPDATEALRQVPGVHVDQSGPGGISSIYVRGGDPNFTVVMLDGIPVNDPMNTRGGSVDLSLLDVLSTDHIEVVRGPLSAVHGSDAMSGAVNILTDDGYGPTAVSTSAAAGRFGTARVTGRADGPVGERMRWSLATALDRNDEEAEKDGRRLATLAASTDWHPYDDAEARLILRYADADVRGFPDGSGGPRFALIRQAEARTSDALVGGLRWRDAPSTMWSYEATGDVFRHQEDADSPGIARRLPPNVRDTDFTRSRLGWRNAVAPVDWAEIGAGVDAAWEEGRERIAIASADNQRTSRTRVRGGAYLETLLAPRDDVTVVAGARLDVPDDFGPELSPRVGVTYRWSRTSTRVRASWGRGFKLPSFFSLADPLIGNPHLRPERSEGGEIGLTQPLWGDGLEVFATWFRSQFRDLIDFSAKSFSLVNRSEVRSQGVEAGLRLAPVSWAEATAYATYLDADIVGSREPLRNRPRWEGGVAGILRRNALRSTVRAEWVGDRRDTDFLVPPSGRTHAAGYMRVDVTASWRFSARLEAFIAVDNLLDERYDEVLGFPAPGILPRAGIEARFQP